MEEKSIPSFVNRIEGLLSRIREKFPGGTKIIKRQFLSGEWEKHRRECEVLPCRSQNILDEFS